MQGVDFIQRDRAGNHSSGAGSVSFCVFPLSGCSGCDVPLSPPVSGAEVSLEEEDVVGSEEEVDSDEEVSVEEEEDEEEDEDEEEEGASWGGAGVTTGVGAWVGTGVGAWVGTGVGSAAVELEEVSLSLLAVESGAAVVVTTGVVKVTTSFSPVCTATFLTVGRSSSVM